MCSTGASLPSGGSLAAGGRIAAAAGLILFLELALIRFIAAYVHVFGFYVNFVVIAAFLGMGTGMLRRANVDRLLWFAGPALVVLTGFVLLVTMAPIEAAPNAGEYLWGAAKAADGFPIPLSAAVIGLFALSSLLFVPLGALLGSAMAQLPPLRAYAFDLFGSLLGVAAFALMSRLMTTPTLWFAVAFTVLIALLVRRRPLVYAATACCVGALALVHVTRESSEEHWSPYYRITVHPTDLPGAYQLSVNGVLHQVMVNFERAGESPIVQGIREGYERPYAFVGNIDTALVVGAGTGNNVATLLRLGAKHIDAVEIDPMIARIGGSHPNHPYADPRVHLIVTDARAFLRAPPRKYDVITFGTLDSHALLAGVNSVRLDNYVYTRESFEAAKGALKPGGSVVMYHLSGMTFIAARLYQNLGVVFGSLPRLFTDHRYLFNYTFVAGAGSAGAEPISRESALLAGIEPATDSWPFPYLRERSIPTHYLAALAAVLILGVTFVGMAAGRDALRAPHWPLFLSGAGFLLLETKGITSLALLFGSTWIVNTAVIASILTVALAGTLMVERNRAPSLAMCLAALCALLALSLFFPPSVLAGLAPGARWLAAAAYVGLPVLFASVIFSRLYAAQANPTSALAYNILGAVAGGVLEYGSMLLGLPALNVLVAVIYATAVVLAVRAGGETAAVDLP